MGKACVDVTIVFESEKGLLKALFLSFYGRLSHYMCKGNLSWLPLFDYLQRKEKNATITTQQPKDKRYFRDKISLKSRGVYGVYRLFYRRQQKDSG